MTVVFAAFPDTAEAWLHGGKHPAITGRSPPGSEARRPPGSITSENGQTFSRGAGYCQRAAQEGLT